MLMYLPGRWRLAPPTRHITAAVTFISNGGGGVASERSWYSRTPYCRLSASLASGRGNREPTAAVSTTFTVTYYVTYQDKNKRSNSIRKNNIYTPQHSKRSLARVILHKTIIPSYQNSTGFQSISELISKLLHSHTSHLLLVSSLISFRY